MEVLINSELEAEDVSAYEELIIRGFKAAARLEGLSALTEVSVTFVDDGMIQMLNRDYRGIDAPTDVLSFPQDDDGGFEAVPGMPRMLGDIIISLQRARDQAAEYGHDVNREVMYLAVHGFLHLLGYDHDSPEEQKRMREQEERILRELDLGRD
ncbi:MAG: rRNA maturation RNase YbeY [Bacillota bacterium]|jgi:probable rRNA maturation factor|nr:rRNA maturation RNase YbeY [Bacillota bacterium]NLJ02625.1 rRNA maturation RNase YbeY [Bacillota bacterium]